MPISKTAEGNAYETDSLIACGGAACLDLVCLVRKGRLGVDL